MSSEFDSLPVLKSRVASKYTEAELVNYIRSLLEAAKNSQVWGKSTIAIEFKEGDAKRISSIHETGTKIEEGLID